MVVDRGGLTSDRAVRGVTTVVDEEQCGICREGGGHTRQLTRWPGGRPHWFHDECVAALYQHTEGGDPHAHRAGRDWKGARNQRSANMARWTSVNKDVVKGVHITCGPGREDAQHAGGQRDSMVLRDTMRREGAI